jgi:hypothetical protein
MKHNILFLLTAGMSLLGVTQHVMAVQNGFYLGVDAGVTNLMDKESHSVFPESHQLGDIGASGGGFLGYDFCLSNKTRMAVEIFVDAVGSQTSIKHAGNTYKMNQQYNAGIRLLPAYLFTSSTMGHVILGYANSRFQIKDNGVYGLINTNYNQGGFQTGLGLATEVQNNFFVRVDALYTMYSSSTHQGAGLVDAPAVQSYTNRFSTLAGEVGLYYEFC